MPYDFRCLSPADFEDLVRDLIGRDLGLRFESFAAGPDGGIDGRHATAGGDIIIQAKHFAGSGYRALKSHMKKERASIDRISAKRYILTTSQPLTPNNKAEIAAIIGPSLQSEADILGPGDLNGILRKHSDIEKSHIKLWLSGVSVLERVIRSAAYTFNNITKSEIEAKVQVYAPNPSLNEARDTLEIQHVVIISGPPGVGKTTLAEMLSYGYIAEGWELVAIRSLDDGLASIEDKQKQVFFFDDFLGKVALDRRALAHNDSEIARFIQRVRSSPNARFILTTRAYIFEEARRVSEHLADQRMDTSKYILDVGVYTRRIKARILYNHLLVAGTPQPHISALVRSGDLTKIVDHKNYNPRIIDWMTDVTRVGNLEPEGYPTAFLETLDHPGRLWDIAFRTHISKMCQHLLFSLFFSSEYGVEIQELRVAYDRLHRHLCTKYGEPHDPKDFEEALRILEGGFISLIGKKVNFVNPSLRDYLTEYFDDLTLLSDLAPAACQTDWAEAVWQFGKRLALTDDARRLFAQLFLGVAEEFVRLPVWKQYGNGPVYGRAPNGLSNTNRIKLLIEWWNASEDQRFAELALALARKPVDGFDSWLDGEEVVELIARLRDDGYFDEFPYALEIADNLEEALIDMIERGMPLDELEPISDATTSYQRFLDDRTMNAVEGAIRAEFEEIGGVVGDIESESTLNDHIGTLEKLAERIAISAEEVESAVATVAQRIAEIEESTSVSPSPSFESKSSAELDTFDDVALMNLFAPLTVR